MGAAVVTLTEMIWVQARYAQGAGMIDLTQVLRGRRGKSTTTSPYHKLVFKLSLRPLGDRELPNPNRAYPS